MSPTSAFFILSDSTSHGADIESEHPKYKHIPIFDAVCHNHMHILEYLLEHAAATFSPKDSRTSEIAEIRSNDGHSFTGLLRRAAR
jgi:hypothetical protein